MANTTLKCGVLLQPVVHDGHALVVQAGAGLLGDDLIALVAFHRVLEALQAVDGALDLGVAEHQDLGAVERFEHVLAAQPAGLVVIGSDVGDGLFRVGAGRHRRKPRAHRPSARRPAPA